MASPTPAPDTLSRMFSLTEDVASIKAMQEDMYHRLFGNGNLGILKEHDLRIDGLETIVKEAKGAKWMLATIGTVMGTVWGILVGGMEWVPKILHYLGLK